MRRNLYKTNAQAVEAAYALMSTAHAKYYRGPIGARFECPVRSAVFHAIGNAEDNAGQTLGEQHPGVMIGTDEGNKLFNEYFLASIYTENEKAARILNFYGLSW